MEAEDNQGDTEDLWVTLSNMGYNKGLTMDEVGMSGSRCLTWATTTSSRNGSTQPIGKFYPTSI